MNDTPLTAAPVAPAESFATPEAAQAEYRRYAGSAEYQQAAGNPHASGPALARLTALAKAAWPTPGQAASPAPQSPEAIRQAREAHIQGQHQQSANDAGEAAPLSEAELQQMADAFAPRSADDYRNSIPDASHPYAADLRQMFFADQISPSVVNLVRNAPHVVEQAGAMSDEDYFAACDKAAADVRGLPGGKLMLRKALDMVEALPDGHPYIPIAEALLMRSGGIQEIAHWSDRLRKAKAH